MIDVVSSLMIIGTVGGFFTAGYKVLDSKVEPINKMLLDIQLHQANIENTYLKKDVYNAESKQVDSKIVDIANETREELREEIKDTEERLTKRVEKIEQVVFK
jgi:hypothetical protein